MIILRMHQDFLSISLFRQSIKLLSFIEVLKLERDLAWAKQGLNMKDEELSTQLIRFYEYFTQYDERRNLNFLETFPEMKDFWNEAKEEYEVKYGS